MFILLRNSKNGNEMIFNNISGMKPRILTLILLICCQNIFSQELVSSNTDSYIANYKEDVYIRTDRDIYITGERVWFKVYEMNGLSKTPSNLSKVIYVELLGQNNFPLKQVKVKNDNKSGSSGFVLPDNMSSGNYIIRAYTNWMKNFSTDQFFYKTISVINPFESIDHLKLPSNYMGSDSARSIKDGLSQALILDDKTKPVYMLPVQNESKNNIRYSISLGKPDYSSREMVKMEIIATDMAGNPVETDFSVSVAKSAVVNSSGSTSFYCFNKLNPEVSNNEKSGYIPELEGQLISGYLRSKLNDDPIRNEEISLSFVGKTALCQFSKTDEKGEFKFAIKESGQKEIVIQPLSSDITGYYIELNQPFSNKFSKFKPVDFYLDSSRIDAINKVIVGMQVNSIYEPFKQKTADEYRPLVPDFFGKPESTIKTADYIELTSLREIVKEIIPNVYTLKQNGKYDFKLVNKFKGQPFESKPLVLVDGVPVYDFEKVLGINSKEIERTDVVNTRYFYSDNVFDGIISFITKKGNLSVLDFDNAIFRQVYDGCQVHSDFYIPDYSTDTLRKSHIPDFRNTLCWKPDLHTDKNGKAEVTFFTSDEASDFRIVVEGISDDGKTGYSSIPFAVK